MSEPGITPSFQRTLHGDASRQQDTPSLTTLVSDLVAEARALPVSGKVANYIPALAEVDPNRVALAMATIDGQVVGAGEADHRFSIQSLSKIFGLTMAMNRVGDSLWKRVNMEPSGQSFNSIVQLEWEHGIPRNPFINAGAILVADVLNSHYSSSKQALLRFVRQLALCESIYADDKVYRSEKQTGNRNAALAYLMKSFGNIESDVTAALDHYFYQCALALSCKEMAKALSFLANRGVHPFSGQQVCSRRDAHRINAILSTSGMYNQSGEFAFTVGLPAKSGVGGGIVAIVPGYGVIAAYSPRLNDFGNSVQAMHMITRMAEELGLSVF
ncbi:glutaminase A [Aliiglaciecola sp. CAU 1673]|uniref:glutaminase A n=1 Tax=Aliiglaciecola sp. CAU 1673 TaxID=3032595 RepID=UPI0023DBCD0E|nr:glutaminase A [Aliiglaciecola sp. CAU 1673]MDF2178843.1 glutaminase A [Aliiglaciecola sp. CAU 1673]